MQNIIGASKELRELGQYKICLEKYGDRNFVNPNLAKQTKKEKYGFENYNNIEQIKQTWNNKN